MSGGEVLTIEERRKTKVEGLLPAVIRTLPHQRKLVLENLRMRKTPIEKYIFLRELMDRNSVLFYNTLIHNVEEILPLVYTPVVGEACVRYSDLIFPHHGIFLPASSKGHFQEILSNWPERDIRVIVVTDGERILGLGDLGANGMGIPIGKLSLYIACAGIDPRKTLPITLDMGTNSQEIRDNPNYIGLKQSRIKGREFDELVEEFVVAANSLFPKAMIQWEDFGNSNAFRVLSKYQKKTCSFNDDIQGTACVALGGLFSACKITQIPLHKQKILFLGAGEAGVGIGDLIAYSLVKSGGFSSLEEARKSIFYVDSKGLVCKSRGGNLAHHKQRYAHDVPFVKTLEEAVTKLRPNVIVGVSAQPQTFTKEVLEKMGEYNERPIIFALSNPTSKAECTAEQAYKYTKGRAIFASGSPFDPVELNGKTFIPGQGNNAYVFPGVGLGAISSQSREISEDMFIVAAETLSSLVSKEERDSGLVYPTLNRIRDVSIEIAVAVASLAFESGLASVPKPSSSSSSFSSVHELVMSHVYQPEYTISSKL